VDGSSDRAADLVRAFAKREARVELRVSPEQRGKIAMLKELVAMNT